MRKVKPKRGRKHCRYIPKIPMMPETRDKLAMELRMAVETLISNPSIDAYNFLSTRFITLGRVAGQVDCLESAKAAMLDVFARFERVGKIGVDAMQAERLRTAVGEMDAMIGTIPVNKLAVSEMKTEMWCKLNGVGS
jgi:hypothetical protein